MAFFTLSNGCQTAREQRQGGFSFLSLDHGGLVFFEHAVTGGIGRRALGKSQMLDKQRLPLAGFSLQICQRFFQPPGTSGWKSAGRPR